jgi:hypothetical protein
MQSPDGKITKKVGGPHLEKGLEGWTEVPAPEKKKRTRAKQNIRHAQYHRPDY